MEEMDNLKLANDALNRKLNDANNKNEELRRLMNDLMKDLENQKLIANSNADKLKETIFQRDNLKTQLEKIGMSSSLGLQNLQEQLNEKEKQLNRAKDELLDANNVHKDLQHKLRELGEESRNAKGENPILKKQLTDTEKVVDVLNKEKLQTNKNQNPSFLLRVNI